MPAGTFISTILFGLVTYFLVIIRVVKRSHLGPAPLVECMLYGEPDPSCLFRHIIVDSVSGCVTMYRQQFSRYV